MAYRLGGRNSLPYLGVEAPTPPNTVIVRRSPTINDNANFNLGTFWLVPEVNNNSEELWILINLDGGIATWVQLYPTGAGGASQFIEDVGIANDAGGVINVIGGATSTFTNINTFGSGNTIEVRLNDTIQWPDSDPTLSQGAIFMNNRRFMHDLGTDSTFLGALAGPSVEFGVRNTGIGSISLSQIVSTAQNNTAVGYGTGFNITSGDRNLLLGYLSGSTYTVENNNIAIANLGTAADSGVIRIGSTLQTDCYITGIRAATITTPARMVLVDTNDKLGGATITSNDGSILITQGANTIDFSTTGVDTNKPAFYATFTNDPVIVTNPNVAPLTGTFSYVFGTVDYSGNPQIMTVTYDDGSNFYPGDGAAAPAYFQAPVTGKYHFDLYVTFSGAGIASSTSSVAVQITIGSRVIVNAVPVTTMSLFFAGFGNIRTYSYGFSTDINMTSGDQALFTATVRVNALGLNQGARVLGTTTVSPNVTTWVTGHQIA